ncbi:zinc finger protein 652-like isoform X11 [Leptopilina heterotoma]|uniref:zinc finger protein 652-like isoform X11 n=1 Tax=Leptopilina heterotoma TaxID=63436 RepID=UPI001CA874F2|nr:zinc finger protein 652-like isoform X11 [Leptopilina heterotoma]
MSSLDYLDLCRLCLVKDRVGISIFEDDGDVRQVFLKIASCLPVKVSREDKLPKKICDDCMYKLELFYQFWNTTANAEKQLLQWLDDVDMQDKQGYVTEVLNSSIMKQEQQASENRLDESVMQVSHQNNMGMGMMDNMGLGMPIIISTTNQPMTSVPMDTSGSSVQTIQAVPGTSTQSTHDQISQNQSANVGHHEVDEDSDEDEENESDDECDADDGLPVKEENEEDPNNRTVEPTTFVNVSLPCDEAGPSGLQQQKITEMPEMAMPQVASADNKTGDGTAKKEERPRRGRKRKKTAKENRIKIEPTIKNEIEIDFLEVKLEPNVIVDQPKKKKSRRKQIPVARRTRAQMKILENSPPSENEEESSEDEEITKEAKCSICDEQFKTANVPEKHWKSHEATYFPNGANNPGFFECDQCDKKFSKRFQLGRHRTAHKLNITEILKPKKKYEKRCPLCHKRFRSPETFQKHMEESNPDHRDVECDYCKKIYKSRRTLIMHIKQHEEKLICHICGATRASVGSMTMHIRRHNKDYNVFCDLCNKGFYHKAELRLHLFHGHTDRLAIRPFICQFCGNSYRSSDYLKIHVNSVHLYANEYKRKRYKCELCNFDTHLLKCLTNHKKMHTGENLIPCKYCDKLINKTYMTIHIRSHTGEKPFTCTICNKSYIAKKNLVRHQHRNHNYKT